MRVAAVILAVIAMAGCAGNVPLPKDPAPVAAKPVPASKYDDSYAQRIDKQMDYITKMIDINNRGNQLLIESANWHADCKNIEPEEWDAKKCERRRKALLGRLSTLNADVKQAQLAAVPR